MRDHIMTYEEFKESHKDVKYLDGTHKCIVCGKVPAYWEIGDTRYYCSACEEHSGLKDDYKRYCRGLQ